MIRIGPSIRPKYFPAATVDPDAQAFITAAGITDATQQSAINTLVTDLKGYGVWSKMKAIYPFVGGTATTHKYNLKDPADTNAAFRLVFNGGWVHSSTGALPNGVNSYALTFFAPTPNADKNSVHISYYSRTDASGGIEMGSEDLSNVSYCLLGIKSGANNSFVAIGDYVGNLTTNTDGKGFYTAQRISSSTVNRWKNGIKTSTYSQSSVNNNTQIVIGTWIRSTGTFGSFTTKQCAFASMGLHLSDSEASDFNTAVQAFQTTLGRNV